MITESEWNGEAAFLKYTEYDCRISTALVIFTDSFCEKLSQLTLSRNNPEAFCTCALPFGILL